MSVKADIETGRSRLPAGCAPVAGEAVEQLFDIEGPGYSNVGVEMMRYGWITRDAPSWCRDRLADWWLVYEGDDLTVPLVWRGDELTGTIVVWREHEEDDRTARERRLIAAQQKHLHNSGALR